jgi:protein-tyrosine phosphatase
VRVLFVCLGNICRSPTAEALMRAKVRDAGLQRQIDIDSAGTGSWHVGEPPDPRAVRAARARGVELESYARQVGREDFEEFDLILAMDYDNLSVLERLAPEGRTSAELRLLREFEPPNHRSDSDGSGRRAEMDVPDPYYGGGEGFDRVVELLEACCDGLLEELRGRSAGRSGGLGGSGEADGGVQGAQEVQG